MRETRFFRQADLLVQVMPFVNAEGCFGLKGGTAINFFVRDFPRLSVDIDLVYLPVEDRAATLQGIDTALQRIAAIDVFQRANQARNVLFLADRDALVDQALTDGFKAHLPDEPRDRIYTFHIDQSKRLPHSTRANRKSP